MRVPLLLRVAVDDDLGPPNASKAILTPGDETVLYGWLFYGDTLGEVARFIHITAAQHSTMVGKELQRNYG